MHYGYFIFVLLVFTSCSSLKLYNTVAGSVPKNKPDTVYFVSKSDNLDFGKGKIGDFKLKEDWSEHWQENKSRLIKFSKSKNANVIFIKTIGWNKNGHGFYVDGSLYHMEGVESAIKKTDDCYLVLFRANTESIITPLFNLSIKVNDNKEVSLKNQTSLREQIKNCEGTVELKVNNKIYNIQFDGSTKYFRIGKHSGGSAFGNTVFFTIGGVYCEEIKDKTLGKILAEQY